MNKAEHEKRTTLWYDPFTNAVTVWLPATATFQYDANGNLLSDGKRGFVYDDENQLTRVTVTNAWKTEFQYDGKMRLRVRKEYAWRSGAFTPTNEVRYVYDGMLVIQERNAGNIPLATYTRGLDLSSSRQGAGGIGGLLARTDNGLWNGSGTDGAHTFYSADGNGNITCLLNSKQIVVGRYVYDPYGNTVSLSGPQAEANPYRFSSKEYMVNSGLYAYGYRFYEPSLQRWLNRDPLEEEFDGNLYRFVFNSPDNYIDADGLSGTLTINSSGTGGSSSTSGHSWICYTPEGGSPKTYGTWGNNPRNLGNGLHENLEQGRQGEASRSQQINDDDETRLKEIIKEYQNKGAKGWKLFKPCSTFAREAWRAGTGEKLRCGFPSTPSTLKKSIMKKNAETATP